MDQELNCFDVTACGKCYIFRTQNSRVIDAVVDGRLYRTEECGDLVLPLAQELYAHQAARPGLLPKEFAEKFLYSAGLPRGEDGITPLPIPRERLATLIAEAIIRDRAPGKIDVEPIIDGLLQRSEGMPAALYDERAVRNLFRIALAALQTRGARLAP